MLELVPAKKYKIQLSDYDFQKDINHRKLLASLSPLEIEILEEILFHPLTIPLRDLSRSLELSLPELEKYLKKLQASSLFSLEEEALHVDKEARKYFEIEIERFAEEFKPDLEFFHSLLKKVPIHSLIHWYSIPKSSDHIFSSLIEKQISSPYLYEKHLLEVSVDASLKQSIDLLFERPDLCLPIKTLQKTLSLSEEELETLLLNLEFHLIGFSVYRNQGNSYQRYLVPLREWEEYLLQEKKTSRLRVAIQEFRKSEFAFVKDLKLFLEVILPGFLPWKEKKLSTAFQEKLLYKLQLSSNDFSYIEQLLQVALQLQLLDSHKESLMISKLGEDWLSQTEEDQAIYLYRHIPHAPHNPLSSERNLKAIEKGISHLPMMQWIDLAAFLEKAPICLGEDTKIQLKKWGKHWSFVIPTYTEEEKAWIQSTIMEKLFESGIVSIGFQDAKPFFRITSFGYKFLHS